MLVCFDFQAAALKQSCGGHITLQLIDFDKFERGFLIHLKLSSKKILLSATGSALLLGYAGGFLSQILNGYAVWRESGGIPGSGTSPPLPSLSPAACLRGLLTFPYGLYGLLLCGGAVVLLILYRRLSADSGEYDIDRNFTYASSGTYGTSGWMTRQELSGILELVHDLRGHTGTVLGLLGSEIVCVPEKSRLNRNIAVYGVSGSMKTRSYCLNRILQGVAAGESLVINDPKSELYETTSEYLATKGLHRPACSIWSARIVPTPGTVWRKWTVRN